MFRFDGANDCAGDTASRSCSPPLADIAVSAKIVVSIPREDHRRSLTSILSWLALGLGALLSLTAAVLRSLGVAAVAVPMVLLGISLYARSRSDTPTTPKRRGAA